MKRNDWILIIATALYTFLFYKQAAGINFLIFNIALIVSLCLKEKQETLNIYWWMAAAGSIATAVCITLYGNTFSLVTNLVSLSLLAGLSFSSRSSVVLAVLHSWYSYFSSPVFMLLDYIERKKNRTAESSNVYTKRLALVLIPVFITIVFFFIYKSSSALFNDFAQKINLDFISWNWVRFTLLGFIILYGFFYHRQIRSLATADENAKSKIEPGQGKKVTLFGKELLLDDENFSATVLFVLLNLLLVVVNYLDFNYLFVDGNLPSAITYSEFVHQGVGMLILSIVIAIIIVLFYFRGELNFFHKNKLLKAMAYLWVLQNAAMVVLTIFRNEIYISEYALTYKRIGVFIYLGLALIGLITTLIKIAGIKSNNYLFRINGWLFFTAFVVLSFFNWDRIITVYNIEHSKSIDVDYLCSLSWNNIPEVIDVKTDSLPLEGGRTMSWTGTSEQFPTPFSKKLYEFMLDKQISDWRAWSLDRSRVYNALLMPHYSDKITTIDLSYEDDIDPEALKQFTKINDLNLRHTNLKSISSLHHFPLLKELDLGYNDLASLEGIEKFTLLKKINLSGNNISDYTPLYSLKNLQEIHVEGRMNFGDTTEIKKHLPNVIITY